VEWLKSKPTQGLLWRFIDHVVGGWKELRYHNGLVRALLGLGRTHTRRLYKAENYRGCALSTSSNLPHTCSKIDPTSTPKRIPISQLSKCMWCSDIGAHKQHTENRRHVMFYCNHPSLQNFRTKMSKLIEQKLRGFFEDIKAKKMRLM